MEDELRYPIGKFVSKDLYSAQEVFDAIEKINSLPTKLENSVSRMSEDQLNTPYRDGGWTVRQVLHHVPDSHMNAYVRTKWTLTENAPLIKAYNEKLWADTPETTADPSLSLNLLRTLHAKWVILLKQLKEDDLQRHFVHPETGKSVKICTMINMYAWHGDHHLAHITSLKERMKW
jgi:hypothetical protein